MRIFVASDADGPYGGLVALARDSAQALATLHRVEHRAIREDADVWQALRAFTPDAILYVVGVTASREKLRRTHQLRSLAPKARLVWLHPLAFPQPQRLAPLTRWLHRRFGPDAVLTESYRSLLGVSRTGLSGDVLPPGTAATARPPRKAEASHRFLVCAPRIGDAGLAAAKLRGLAKARVEVLDADRPARQGLPPCDTFVFCATGDALVPEVPTEILDALASGAPVLTTPFGGVPDFFPERDDVRYWRTSDELLEVAAARMKLPRVTVRGLGDFTWPVIAKRMSDVLA